MPSADLFLLVIFALCGLTFGSAANVLITRIPMWLDQQHEIASDAAPGPRGHRSQCPNCLTSLRATMLIPILSYVWLGGRCHFCQARIHWRYPAIEALASAWFIVCLLVYPDNPTQAGVWAFWGLALLTMAWIDGASYWLPDVLTLPFLVLGLVVSLLGLLITTPTDSFVGALAGWSVLMGVGWIYRLRTQRVGFGGGDTKLLAGLGAWFGWSNLPWILFFAALTGAAFGIMRAVHKGQSLRAQEPLPFGPFLAIGGLLICLHEWRFFGSQ